MKLLYNGLVAFITIFAICEASRPQSRDVSSSDGTAYLTVTVTNSRNEIVSGLPKTAFTVSDDTGVREITSFSHEDDPMSIAILVDLSGSIKSATKSKKIDSIVDGLSQFIQKSHPLNEYFVIGFNTKPYLLLDGTRDANAVLAAVQGLSSVALRGNTNLFDACLAGIEKVARGVYSKQIILLLSDGQDNNSQYKLNDVRRLLKERNVLVYSLDITMGWDGPRVNEFNIEGSQVLEQLASLTGGALYSPSNTAEIKADLEQIALEVRRQYSIGFLPAKDISSGKWHPLKIKVSLPADSSVGLKKASVRSRNGYYSTSFARY